MLENQEQETNSKAFTAKTSCVRRRYRLYRNFLGSQPSLAAQMSSLRSDDKVCSTSSKNIKKKKKEKMGLGRTELQGDAACCPTCVCPRVLQSVVLLSDSQLHLFLQSQLSVPEIEACVRGQSRTTVSDAILRYAMSNCGWAQEERQGSSHLAKGDQPKSCCFFPRSGRSSSPSTPPEEEKDHFEVWAPVVDSEAPSWESPPLLPPTSPSCCDFARPDEGPCAPQPVRRSLGGDHALPLDPSQLETVLEK
ncbi:sorting nexin-11 isoform X2 [Myotis myotis]|uniref:sorting nexin-11 isoform X2 n=1 Tax=Myotis myotis TaxID=51298 RepID=UPI00174DCC22|nr:sorting nexin-11 isoform X2 [Myotis myotis]XP_036195128.1 sorting nexin-11 isoform X2 [Myotis myotis]